MIQINKKVIINIKCKEFYTNFQRGYVILNKKKQLIIFIK